MKRIVIALIVSLAAISPLQARRYPFVRMENNELLFPGEKGGNYSLYASKMDSMLRGFGTSVKVLHLGGSHVQAGIWTDRMRTRFLSLRYGMDGGRGLVFPFAAIGTNTPVSYTTVYEGEWERSRCLRPERDMGICGAAATAKDTKASFSVDLLPNDPKAFMKQRYSFNRVSVLGYGDMEPVLILAGRDTLRGDAAGEGRYFTLPHFVDWIKIGFDKTAGGREYTVEGVYLDKSGSGFTMSEAGINGASSQSWLACAHFEDNLKTLAPDMVILSIGINDIKGADFNPETFKDNYRKIIGKILRVNPHCALIFSGINDSYTHGHVNPHTDAAQKAFYELAKEYGAAFWDMYSIMGGPGSIALWQEAGLAKSDRVHFTTEGYRLLGDMLYDAIMRTLR